MDAGKRTHSIVREHILTDAWTQVWMPLPRRTRCATSSRRRYSSLPQLVGILHPATPFLATIFCSFSGDHYSRVFPLFFQLSVCLIFINHLCRKWAPPRAAVTRWWPSTDPAVSSFFLFFLFFSRIFPLLFLFSFVISRDVCVC